MNYFLAGSFVALTALTSAGVFAQDMNSAGAAQDIYMQLVDATNFIANYKEMAAVSAEVSAARGQGSDAEYAKVMTNMARSDISDIKGCVARAYSNPPITSEDATELVATFKSPVGKKMLSLSQAMLINYIRHGSPQGPDPAALNSFSDKERQQLIEIRQSPSFVHYNQLIGSDGFKANLGRCIMQSRAFRQSGIKS